MRHLNKSYPHQLPSKNRSSKHLNILIGNASVFPAHLSWSDAQLLKFANKCKNKNSNCFIEELNARKSRKMNRPKRAKSVGSPVA